LLQRFRHILFVALIALVALPVAASRAGSGASSAAAGPSTTWAVGSEATLPSNAVTLNQNVSINAISCPSAGNCGAVGTYADGSGHRRGVLLTETAGTWAKGVEAALPGNAASANPFVDLNSISCASAGNCTAVGGYDDNSGGFQGLLLTESAGTWATGVEAVLPANAASANPSAGLAAVSCASAGNCSAVGSYDENANNNVDALLLTETGGTWSSGIEAALPADAATFNGLAGLGSISCPSAGNCTAVGGYLFMSGPDSWASQALMVTETAGTWATGVAPTLPAGARTPNPFAGLNSVSCASAGNCTAVGGYSDGSTGNQGLLLTETAGSWATGVEAVLPADAGSVNPLESLSSVSCAAAGNCSAVGSYFDNQPSTQGLLLSETDGTWARESRLRYRLTLRPLNKGRL
jgi:hypothetical protein